MSRLAGPDHSPPPTPPLLPPEKAQSANIGLCRLLVDWQRYACLPHYWFGLWLNPWVKGSDRPKRERRCRQGIVNQDLRHLRREMCRSATTAKPCFRGKAADTRQLLPILREMLLRCFALQSDHEQLRYQCVDALHRCYVELQDWSPQDSPYRLARHGRQHLLLYVSLRSECDDELLWSLYPKHHLFIHLVEGAVTNPRLEWNYSDESEIGVAKTAASTANVAHIATRLIGRYRDTFEA